MISAILNLVQELRELNTQLYYIKLTLNDIRDSVSNLRK